MPARGSFSNHPRPDSFDATSSFARSGWRKDLPAVKHCAQCGGQSSDRSQYCYHCGASLAEPKAKSATVPQGPLVPPRQEARLATPDPPVVADGAAEQSGCPARGHATTVDDPALGPTDAARDGAGAALARPEPAAAAAAGQPLDPQKLAAAARRSATASPGTVVDGKYAIERVLGRGGMGVVYLARELHTGVEVVLKAVRAEIAHRAEVRRRTFAEGRALARIDHANVVQLKAVVSEPDDLWLVMQYIEGESLEQTIERSGQAGVSMSMAEVLRIFRQVAAGVAAAHREGLIHRDLKPGNILVRRKDGVVKVTDFGIAKVEQDALAGKSQTKGFVGSPFYTSPEQVTGQRDLDRRVDIYALGILLYEMFTGQVPFDAESTFEIMRMHTEQPLPSVTALRPDVPAAVDGVLAKAAAKDREQRFQSCEELLQALEAAAAPPAEAPGPVGPSQVADVKALGTVSAAAAALPTQQTAVPRKSHAWLYVLLPLLLVGAGVGAALATGLVVLPSSSKPKPSAPPVTTTSSSPPATSASAEPPPPLEQLAGRWVSDSGRAMDAVLVADALEFRVVDAKHFAPQDYRVGEPRFVLHRLPGEDHKFAVEDRIRPLPPTGHKYDSARARTTCYAVWTKAKGEPLRAGYDGKQLSVYFAKIEPEDHNFVKAGRTIVSCRGLEKLGANRVHSVLRRP